MQYWTLRRKHISLRGRRNITAVHVNFKRQRILFGHLTEANAVPQICYLVADVFQGGSWWFRGFN